MSKLTLFKRGCLYLFIAIKKFLHFLMAITCATVFAIAIVSFYSDTFADDINSMLAVLPASSRGLLNLFVLIAFISFMLIYRKEIDFVIERLVKKFLGINSDPSEVGKLCEIQRKMLELIEYIIKIQRIEKSKSEELREKYNELYAAINKFDEDKEGLIKPPSQGERGDKD